MIFPAADDRHLTRGMETGCGTRGGIPGLLLGVCVMALVSVLVAVMMVSSARAAAVEGLYQAELLVAEQASPVPAEQLAAGMRQVIVKVTGRQDLFGSSALASLLEDPEPYLLKFSYQGTSTPIADAEGRQSLAHRLVLEFDQRLIDSRLVAAGIRPLGSNRPALLTWIVEEQGGIRDFAGREEDPALVAMGQRARLRGIPLYRPLMDLTDIQALPAEDVWGFFERSIRRASSRYDADAVLAGKLYQTAAGLESRWLLLWNEQSYSFEGAGDSLEAHLTHALDKSADRLFSVSSQAVAVIEREGSLVKVENVRSLGDYLTLLDFMSALSSARRVELERVEGMTLTWRVVLDGSLAQLREELRLNDRLQPVFRVTSSGQEPLDYYWR